MNSQLTVGCLAESADAVRATLRELSEVGMIRPHVLVDADLRATLIDNGQAEPIDLDSYLAENRSAFCRLIRLSLDGEAISEPHLAVINRVESRLSDVGTVVERGSIVVPLHGATIARDAFATYWDYNLIVEPVDAAGEPNFMPLELTDPARQVIIAANVLALAGGLWQWLERGPLDHGAFRDDGSSSTVAKSDGVAESTRVRLIRATTRIVDAGNVATQAVGTVLSADVQFPPPPGCVRHGDPYALVDEVVNTVVPVSKDESPLGFTYRAEAPPPPPAFEELTFLGAIKRFISECVDEMKRLPAEVARRKLEQVRASVADAIQNNTFGPDSQLRVAFAEVHSATLLDQGARADAVASLPHIKAQAPAETPETWESLNQLVFALADGSELPASFKLNELDWNGDRGVVSDVSLLVTPRLVDEDAGKFILTVDDLESLGWDADEEIHIAGTDAFGARAILARPMSSTKSRRAAAADGEESDHDTDSSDHTSNDAQSPFDDPPDPSTAADARNDDDDRDASTDEASDFRERLGEWRAERERTLLWRLAHRLMEQQDAALDDLTAASSELESLLEQLNNALAVEEESRKRFRRWSLAILALLIVGLTLGTVGIVFTLFAGAAFWTVIMAVTLVTSLWAMMRTVRARVRDKNAARRLERMPAYVQQRRQTAANEYARLSSLYAQLMDWAEVQAVSLHRPFGEGDDVSEQPWTTTVGALSFVCGKPGINEEAVDALSLSAAQQVARRGWINRAYQHQRNMIVNDYTRLAGGVAGSDRPPESDNAMDQGIVTRVTRGGRETIVYPPRSSLVRGFRDGAAAQRYRDEHFASLEGAISANGPLGAIDVVECDVTGLNQPPRNVEQFLLPIVEAKLVEGFRSVTDRRLAEGVDVRSMAGVTVGVAPESFVSSAVEVDVAPLASRTTLAAFRVDISEPLALDDVSMIDRLPERDDQSRSAGAGIAGEEDEDW